MSDLSRYLCGPCNPSSPYVILAIAFMFILIFIVLLTIFVVTFTLVVWLVFGTVHCIGLVRNRRKHDGIRLDDNNLALEEGGGYSDERFSDLAPAYRPEGNHDTDEEAPPSYIDSMSSRGDQEAASIV